ncbi:MAG: DUF4388 domain-containing protein [Acidobacteriota bacterium]
MSINGVLEDLPLADVLQFVHLGRRTGTLYMWRDEEHRAEIAFHDGKIVSAWTPGQKKLGDLLVDAGLIDQDVLRTVLREQQHGGAQRTLGRILVDQERVTRDEIHGVIRDQVQKTIFELVTWRRGRFHFEIDELHPVDDFSLEPGEVLDDLDLNTQMLLLEATRLFDERNREAGAPPPVEAPPTAKSLDHRLRRAGLARGGRGHAPSVSPPEDDTTARGRNDAALEALRCQVVTEDDELLGWLRERLPTELLKIVSIRFREAGNRLPGEGESPIVLLDLRHPQLSATDVASVARTRPAAPLIALAADEDSAAAARRAGALSALVAGDETLADTLRSFVRTFNHPTPQGTFGYAARGGYGRFRRVVFDVQSGLLSATMALNLMHVISESVERAVLFLVQDDELTACGAFGFSTSGEPLATLTRSLKLTLGARGSMREALDQAKPLSVDFDAADLPPDLARMVGQPASGQVVLFPVLGAERPISLIYTDNGTREQEIQDIRILELATSQVGVAFENELLRRQLGDHFDGAELDELVGGPVLGDERGGDAAKPVD